VSTPSQFVLAHRWTRSVAAVATVVAMLAAGGPKPAARLGLAGRPAAAGPPLAERPVATDLDPVDPELTAFTRDLTTAGNVAPPRARAVARHAVREARAHGIPLALMFGVLLVENDALDSHAVSSAGARGLMQVDPLWRPLLGARHGYDLAADSTSLGMGAHILADLLDSARSLADVERGLLRYNGCRVTAAFADPPVESATDVGIRRHPTCAGYARRVRQRIERQATALCPTHSFARCVVRPIRLATIASARQDTARAPSTH
jgi:soluble lytic murein transglycosylase-like protein